MLIVRIQWRGRKRQPRERKLQRGGVTPDQLFRNVQVDAIVVLVCVVQRTVRHQEEVVRSEVEGVRGRRGHKRARLLHNHRSRPVADMSVAHAIKMTLFAIYGDTAPSTVGVKVADIYGEQVFGGFRAVIQWDHPVNKIRAPVLGTLRLCA